MRVFNVRFAVILLVVMFVFSVGVYALHAFQVRRSAVFFEQEAKNALERAATAKLEKDPDAEKQANKEALECLNWYVQLTPTDTDAMEQLGTMLAERSSLDDEVLDARTFAAGIESLEKVVRLKPDQSSARRKLAKMSMMLRWQRFQDAEPHLQVLLKESPKDSELLEQMGRCMLGLGRYKEAREALEKSVTANPSQVTAYKQLAEVLRVRLEKPEEADRWMDKLVKANPKSSKAHYFRSQYLADPEIGKTDEAVSEAIEALRLAPEDADVLYWAIRCYRSKGQQDKARECAERGVKLHPINAKMYRSLASVELYDKKVDKAIAVYEQGIRATKRDPELVWELANLLIDVKKLEEAKKIIEELRKLTIYRAYIGFLEARIELVQGRWVPALRHFEAVRGAMAGMPGGVVVQVDYFISLCYEQLQERDKQEQALRRALSIDPSFPPAREALDILLLSQGKIDPESGGASPSKGRGSSSGAVLVSQAKMLLIKTARKPASERDWQAVEDALTKAEKAAPDNAEIPLVRAQLFIMQEKFADAEKLLLAARDKNPKQMAYWSALLSLAQRQKDQKKVERLLKESQAALGDSVEARVIQAQQLLQQKGNDKDVAQRLRKLAENAEQFPEAGCVTLWSRLMDASRRVGDVEQALSLGWKIADKQPNNVQVLYGVLDIAFGSSDQATAKKALERIKGVTGKDWCWLYGQAVLILQSKDNKDDQTAALTQALDYLKQAREKRKNWAKIPLAEAGAYDRLGKTDEALRCYREAIELGERNPNALLRLIQILYQTRQTAEANRLLARFEREGVQLPSILLRVQAEGALQQGDTDRAVVAARRAVPMDSKDYRDHVWLGQLLGAICLQAKDKGVEKRDVKPLVAVAEEELRKAVELEPKAPDAWVALVRFLVNADKKGEANAALVDAEKKIPPKDAPLALASCCEAIGKLDEAQGQYEAALKAAPANVTVLRTVADFYRRTGKLLLAETALQKILDGKVPAKEAEIVWARRQLAGVYISRRNYKSLKKAQSLVEQNLASPQASAIEYSLLAKLKASDPDPAVRKEAMGIFKGLIDRNSAGPDDILEFAGMLNAAGNWPEASTLLRDLVASNSKDQRSLEVYIDLLLKHNEISNAEMYLNRLEKLSPNAFQTVSLRADLLCAGGKPAEALSLLQDFIERPNAIPREWVGRLRLAAEKIDRLGRQLTKPDQSAVAGQFAATAEALYRKLVREKPEQDLVLAVFLGTRTKVDEALNILDRAMPAANPVDFGQACLLIVQGGKSNKEQLQRLDGIIQSFVKKHERSIVPMLATADLRTRQGKYAEAVSGYRKVLEKAPDNFMALNNLAVLLALQGANLDEALKLVDQAIDVAGPQGAMLDSRAIVHMAMNNSEKALEDMKAAVADQETPVRLFHLAQAYALAGDTKAARTAFDKARKSGLTNEQLQLLELPVLEKLEKLPK
jgi:cellulose synthase operon protein C